MSIQILWDDTKGQGCWACTTSDWAFGPVWSSKPLSEACLEWMTKEIGVDPRFLEDHELEAEVSRWNRSVPCAHCAIPTGTHGRQKVLCHSCYRKQESARRMIE